jgi:hypothetical protein
LIKALVVLRIRPASIPPWFPAAAPPIARLPDYFDAPEQPLKKSISRIAPSNNT